MSPDTCFICSKLLTKKDRSREDVIPLWLQRKYELTNQRCRLLNKTYIPYRSLKVPCCNECNNEHLARLESIVHESLIMGFEATSKLPEGYLYQWLAKIYVGLLYRELFLSLDRKKPEVGSITTPDVFSNARILWLWLQLSFSNKSAVRAPGSIFLFRCFVPPETNLQFDLLDNIDSECIAIRVGEVGIVADLLDNHVHWDAGWSYFKKYQSIPLHPLQFREVATTIFYGASLLDLETEITAHAKEDGSMQIEFRPVSKNEPRKLFREWNRTEYARMLAHYTELPLEKLSPTGDAVWTWLQDASGNLVDVTKIKIPS